MAGQVTARAGDEIWALNSWMRYVATAEQTNGHLAVIEQLTSPAGDTPTHVHANEDEAVYVMEGRIEARIGDDKVSAGPGEFVFLPRGTAHSLHAQTPEVLGLVFVTPAGFDQFFAAVGTPASTRRLPEPVAPEVQALVQAAANFGVTILPPPA